MNNQNYLSTDGINFETLERHEDMNEMLSEINNLKNILELQKKDFENEKFELETKIKNNEREINRLKSSLKSANDMIEVYKSLERQNENSEIKQRIAKLKRKNSELCHLNNLIKQENSELETIKLKYNLITSNKHFEENLKVINNNKQSNTEIIDNNYIKPIIPAKKDSNLIKNFQYKIINEILITINGIIHPINFIVKPIKEIIENKLNSENDIKNKNYKKMSEKNNNIKNDIESLCNELKKENQKIESEEEFGDSISIASDLSFKSKNTNQIKKMFLKIKNQKKQFYENAVELMTESELEIKTLNNENEDLKNSLNKLEKEIFFLKYILKEKDCMRLENNSNLNINSEKYKMIYSNFSNNGNNQLEKILHENNNNTFENLNKNDFYEFEKAKLNKKNISEKYNECFKNIYKADFSENILLDQNRNSCFIYHIPYLNNSENNKTTNEDFNSYSEIYKINDESLVFKEKINNSFDKQEKIKYLKIIDSMENKFLESSKKYEEIILNLKKDNECLELEKIQIQQELEHFKTNKKDLIEDLEYYSTAIRSLQEQKETLEDSMKNKFDILLENNKNLEISIKNNNFQILLLEKEKKEIIEKDSKKIIDLKESFKKEKECQESKFADLLSRFVDCNREKLLFKKQAENLKQSLNKKKKEFEELKESKLRETQMKELEIKTLNEIYKYRIELEANLAKQLISKQEKIKHLSIFIENNINKSKNVESKNESKVNNESNNDIDKYTKIKDYLEINNNHKKSDFNNSQELKDIQLFKNSEDANKELYFGDINPIYYSSINFSNEKQNSKFFKDDFMDHNPETLNNEENLIENNKTKSNIYSENCHFINNKAFLGSINKYDEINNLYGFNTKDGLDIQYKCLNSLIFNSENTCEISNFNAFDNPENLSLAKALEGKIDIKNLENNKTEETTFKKKKNKFKSLNYKKSLFYAYTKGKKEKIGKIERIKSYPKNYNYLYISKKKDKNSLNSKKRNFYKKSIKELDQSEKHIDSLDDDSNSIDYLLLNKELKEKNFVLIQESKNYKQEIEFLLKDTETLEQIKNDYIQKLKKDVEKAEELAANAKFNLCQVNFERENEIIKYKNVIKKLKITIRTLEATNLTLTENINILNSKYISNKHFNLFNEKFS